MKALLTLVLLISSFTLLAEMSSYGKRAICLSFVESKNYPCTSDMLDNRERLLCEAFAMDRSRFDDIENHCELIRRTASNNNGRNLYRFCNAYRKVLERDYSGAISSCAQINSADETLRCKAVVTQIGLKKKVLDAILEDKIVPMQYCKYNIKDDQLSASCLSMINFQDLALYAPELDRETKEIVSIEVNRSRCKSIR